MDYENNVSQLFIGYCNVERSGKEMQANSSVTLVKSENKTILVNLCNLF